MKKVLMALTGCCDFCQDNDGKLVEEPIHKNCKCDYVEKSNFKRETGESYRNYKKYFSIYFNK